jgi:hypothetical protein
MVNPLPAFQSSPGGLSRTSHLRRHVVPPTADRQDKPDHTQYLGMFDLRPTTLSAWRRLYRQQGNKRLQKRIRQTCIDASLLR